jgi:hypothetical protein
MPIEGSLGRREPVGDLAVRHAIAQQRRHLALARTQGDGPHEGQHTRPVWRAENQTGRQRG